MAVTFIHTRIISDNPNNSCNSISFLMHTNKIKVSCAAVIAIYCEHISSVAQIPCKLRLFISTIIYMRCLHFFVIPHFYFL